MDFITNNYEWLFGGIGVAVISFFLNNLFKENSKSTSKATANNSNSFVINNNLGNSKSTVPATSEADRTEILKARIKILFVDDEHTKFKMVSILRKAGWKNTKSVKDITDLDDLKAKEADVIFVDINGVGKTLFNDQGLGLAAALKDRYPNKKIVLYSAETKGDRFHKALREVDGCLSKDAEPYQFANLIETLCR